MEIFAVYSAIEWSKSKDYKIVSLFNTNNKIYNILMKICTQPCAHSNRIPPLCNTYPIVRHIRMQISQNTELI